MLSGRLNGLDDTQDPNSSVQLNGIGSGIEFFAVCAAVPWSYTVSEASRAFCEFASDHLPRLVKYDCAPSAALPSQVPFDLLTASLIAVPKPSKAWWTLK